MASKEKVATTWLQCTLPKADWDKINERRVKLNLKWGDIVIPGSLAYLDRLEAGKVARAEATPKKKKGVNKKAPVEPQEPGKEEVIQ